MYMRTRQKRWQAGWKLYPNTRENLLKIDAYIPYISSVIEQLSAGKQRPSIGTPVEEKDFNYQFLYALINGIRVAVSKEAGKQSTLDNPMLTKKTFKQRVKFEMRGTEGTPGILLSKFDYDFYDHAPTVFSHLRERFGIQQGDYLMSLTSDYMLSQLPTPGKSGSNFFFSQDSRFIIKTISQSEFQVCLKMLQSYYLVRKSGR